MKKTSIITGCAGQDGYYLGTQLLKKGFKVIGLDLPQTKGYHKELKELMENPSFKLIEGDICDRYMIRKLLAEEKPKYFFNLAAISHVKVSFDIPERVTEVNYLAVIRILEEIRAVSPKTAFLQASTSEMFGNTFEPKAIWHIKPKEVKMLTKQLQEVRKQDIIILPPEAEIEFAKQTENSPMRPQSPYAIAKTAAFFITQLYRKYGLKTYNTICFNHESSIRAETFVTRKITKFMADIKLNNQLGYKHPVPNGCLTLGNLESRRDWGYAPDYTEAQIKVIESNKPDDYVVATGETHSVREFIEECCRMLHFRLEWKGKGIKEVGYINSIPRIFISKEFYRPAEVDSLCGDYSKIKEKLGWEPEVKFKDLIRIMIESDLNPE